MANDTSSKPMYEKIFETVKNQILSKEYEVGERIPSEKELADEYNVSRITSKKALELLAGEKLIVRIPGRGSFVLDSSVKTGASDSEQASQLPRSAGRTGHSNDCTTIGLVITDFGNSYGTGLIYGMEQASRDNDCFLVLRRSFGVPDNEEISIQKLLKMGVDGLIVFPAQGEYFNEEILKLVIAKFPLVLVDRHLKGVAAASISTDNVTAARVATEYLFGLGHRHIAFLCPPPTDTSAVEDRIEGFIQAHAEKGIMVDKELWVTDLFSTLPDSFRNDDNVERDVQRLMAHLRQNPSITAVFSIEYNIALLAKAAIERLGMRIPQHISVICFDSPPTDLGGAYAFTHMRQNEEEMGRLAIEHVLRIKEGQAATNNRVTLDAKLVIGQSTGEAPIRT
ncbi:GntR family transcriptional regulator [Paenibacillus harenae]|uniref:DNA-binding LacI/PurR family transcriptional regulator/DNA-binding transcriptional regulator YhcF (GntR family) n=1 Tax=Paenibacillus harenae TaxID=306543 RepID=A0ABT9U8S6_PAEHA|nr:GntR family transcriptional regulator [Paenibacillus harenae]MDQ0116055.1 DNA-binding LacI/PurR family transcriptional regulator/DNA-binding transcriptional regulator YhcF (GntR family) [Paenibacillus harenae]